MMALVMAPHAAANASAPAAAAELDRATLVRCAAGDPGAFRAFVVRYERPVFALLSRILGRGPHVEDLAQETFLRAFRALANFDPDHGAKPSTWLLTIATRLALDARKRRRVDARPIVDGLDVADGGTPERDAARAQLGSAIARAAAELSDDQRAALVLADVHGLTMAEIADALGVPEATAKTRLYRAREHLRARLAPLRKEGLP